MRCCSYCVGAAPLLTSSPSCKSMGPSTVLLMTVLLYFVYAGPTPPNKAATSSAVHAFTTSWETSLPISPVELGGEAAGQGRVAGLLQH